MRIEHRQLRRLAAMTAALALSASASTGDNESGEDGLRDLAAQWWQWALSIPAQVNPLFDNSGARCMVGQRGTTWFLAGTLNGGTVSRTCSIPENATVFFPVVNSVSFDTPNICGQGGSLSVAELRKL